MSGKSPSERTHTAQCILSMLRDGELRLKHGQKRSAKRTDTTREDLKHVFQSIKKKSLKEDGKLFIKDHNVEGRIIES